MHINRGEPELLLQLIHAKMPYIKECVINNPELIKCFINDERAGGHFPIAL